MGEGSSSDPPDPFTITDWSHCLAEFLDVLGIARAHVLGLSWGGVLAQELYRLDPARVLGLVLADTYAGWKETMIDVALSASRSSFATPFPAPSWQSLQAQGT